MGPFAVMKALDAAGRIIRMLYVVRVVMYVNP